VLTKDKESESKHGGAEALAEGSYRPGMLSRGVPIAPPLEQKEAVERHETVEEKEMVDQKKAQAQQERWASEKASLSREEGEEGALLPKAVEVADLD
jgi:hypothetical protein